MFWAGIAAGALERAGITVSFDCVRGACYLDHARNILATRMLESDATDILFVDADLNVNAEAFGRIAAYSRPVVGAVYPKKTNEMVFPVVYEDRPELWSDEEGLIEVKSLPTGFLRINRAVLEFMDRGPYVTGDPDGKTWREIFRVGVRRDHPAKPGVFWGEDTGFCKDWKAAGGKIHLMPDVDFEHWGMRNHVGNWAKWRKSLMELSALAEGLDIV